MESNSIESLVRETVNNRGNRSNVLRGIVSDIPNRSKLGLLFQSIVNPNGEYHKVSEDTYKLNRAYCQIRLAIEYSHAGNEYFGPYLDRIQNKFQLRDPSDFY